MYLKFFKKESSFYKIKTSKNVSKKCILFTLFFDFYLCIYIQLLMRFYSIVYIFNFTLFYVLTCNVYI